MRVGCDPEAFLVNKQGDFISSVGIVEGTKDNPHHLPRLPRGFTIQQDNVSIEFGIPPATSADEFDVSIHTVMSEARKYIGGGLSYSKLSAKSFPKAQLMTAEANVFGCEPDFNAWTGQVNAPPAAKDKALRSAGGHVHVETKLNKIEVIKALDLVLGVPSVIVDKEGVLRRSLYGMPGAYRPKSYGVEYRVLSNFWIFESHHRRWVFKGVKRALDMVMMKVDFNDPRIYNAIATSDVSLAQEVIAAYTLELPVKTDLDY